MSILIGFILLVATSNVVFGQDYFPLGLGYEWQYKITGQGSVFPGTSYFMIDSTFTIDSLDAFRMVSNAQMFVEGRWENSLDTSVYVTSGNKVFLLDGIGAKDTLVDMTFRHTYDAETTYVHDLLDTINVFSIGNINVSAGEFDSCYKVTMVVYGTEIEWIFAPGVGRIKMLFSDGPLYELIDYSTGSASVDMDAVEPDGLMSDKGACITYTDLLGYVHTGITVCDVNCNEIAVNRQSVSHLKSNILFLYSDRHQVRKCILFRD